MMVTNIGDPMLVTKHVRDAEPLGVARRAQLPMRHRWLPADATPGERGSTARPHAASFGSSLIHSSVRTSESPLLA